MILIVAARFAFIRTSQLLLGWLDLLDDAETLRFLSNY
jgi:hypothetical protein